MTQRTPPAIHRSAQFRSRLLLFAAALQIACGLVFASDVFGEIGQPVSGYWMEATGVIVFAVGSLIILAEYRNLARRNRRVERELHAASGAFQEVIEGHFAEWGLTEAERDVALLAIKGVSIAQIAEMRQTREGTVKAQNAAIYRKAGVSGRADLLSVFVEELIAGLQTEPAALAGSHISISRAP